MEDKGKALATELAKAYRDAAQYHKAAGEARRVEPQKPKDFVQVKYEIHPPAVVEPPSAVERKMHKAIADDYDKLAERIERFATQ